MESLENAYRLKRSGRFLDALLALGEASRPPVARIAAEVLRAELLEGVGQHRRAMALATALLRSRQLKAADQSACEYVLGEILLEDGDVVGGIDHLQRSASRAQNAKAFERVYAAQLKLMAVVSERSGPSAAAALLAEVRQLATRLGDPHVTAKLHLFVAEMEAKRGLLENARRHSAIARHVLSTSPNTYLEAFCNNVDLAISVLLCQFDDAKAFGALATELAEQAGVAALYRASLGNVGTLHCAVGNFDRAIEYFERALIALPSSGPMNSARLDSMARVRLSEDRLEECGELLDRVEASIRSDEDRALYGHRYAELTRAHLLASQGRIQDAIVKIASVSALATCTGDGLLLSRAQLTKAALLARLGRVSECVAVLQAVGPELIRESPEMYAQAEQILGCASVSGGDRRGGRVHRDRASRIYKSLRNVTGQVDLDRCWTEALSTLSQSDGTLNIVDRPETTAEHSKGRTLHGIAAAVAYGRHPEFVAREFVDILLTSDCVYSVRATSRASEGLEETISCGMSEAVVPAEVTEHRLAVGSQNERTIELAIKPRSDVESAASINAVRLLLTCIQELKCARAEREQQATLWPIEELPIDDERSVISGRMRELMNQARRIARTKVNVLITGESGTGKEILARAIHDFSDRAHKAFVPLNCSAIPRDLLESQLFGHRRGAFTGADRDHLGLIRTARDGTLFLDEIGELGLDLQPKLLRFLESGEISPLGEPGTLTIDVRIVAATNSNLEDAVRAGKFREDLFYRLNVVLLSIPPLRERRDEIPGFVNTFVSRAAEEFKKGHLRVAEETMERLLLYRWPGNVRQLQNEIRRMVALSEPDSTLLPHAISDEILGALPIFRHAPINGSEIAVGLHDKLLPTIARIECEMIKAALRTHHGKVEPVARALGISRKGLYLKRQRHGL